MEEDIIKHNQLVRVARLYYLCNLTQQEIAEEIGLSRIKVARLLKEGVEKRIVTFTIEDPLIHTLQLEERLRTLFHLNNIVIVPSTHDMSDIYEIIGRFAADFLMRNLRNNITIGVGWGRTLNRIIPYLKKTSMSNVSVISMTGGLSANSKQPNPYDVASAIADKLEAECYYPLVPAIVESEETRKVLFRERSVRRICELWGRIEIAFLSIGVISAQSGFYYSFPDPEAEAAKIISMGAVGDILARPFDISGKMLDPPFTTRTISISMEELVKIPLRVGVAVGTEKIQAILGALRGGFLNALITDELVAREIISLENGDTQTAERSG